MSITGIILTFNESVHIERCIKSILPICDRICIIDSFSTDDTLDICKRLNVDIYQKKWENNHSKQINWALENCNITSDWTLRLDADEYFLPELNQEIKDTLQSIDSDITGIELNRRVYFKDKWIKYGGFYPIKLIRIWKSGLGHSEERFMDEHIVLKEGKILNLKNDFVDENLNSINWWSEKHLNYARREAVDFLSKKYELGNHEEHNPNITKQAGKKRKLKNNIFNRLPLGIRPISYFILRFFIQFGFLDGPKGWIFHFLQAFWYRVIVDINIFEIEEASKRNSEEIKRIIKSDWKINI